MQHAGDEGGEITGINVTPLVDITLVLLIIFMVTAKVIVAHAFPFELPSVSSATTTSQTTLAFGVDDSDRITLDGRVLETDAEITGAIRAARERPDAKDLRAVLHVSRRAHHESVVRVMDALRITGVNKMSFAVKPR